MVSQTPSIHKTFATHSLVGLEDSPSVLGVLSGELVGSSLVLSAGPSPAALVSAGPSSPPAPAPSLASACLLTTRILVCPSALPTIFETHALLCFVPRFKFLGLLLSINNKSSLLLGKYTDNSAKLATVVFVGGFRGVSRF